MLPDVNAQNRHAARRLLSAAAAAGDAAALQARRLGVDIHQGVVLNLGFCGEEALRGFRGWRASGLSRA